MPLSTESTPLLANPAPPEAIAAAASRPGAGLQANHLNTENLVQPVRPRRWGIHIFFAYILWKLMRNISATWWFSAPTPIGVFYLAVKNTVAADWNVKEAELIKDPESLDAITVAAVPELGPTNNTVRPPGHPKENTIRTDSGIGNNLGSCPVGGIGQPFGRNTIVNAHVNLGTPDPSYAARKLLTRDSFKGADSVNLFVAAWIQFLIHDLFDHRVLYDRKLTVGELSTHPTEAIRGRDELFPNAVDHFLDASPLYGDTSRAVDLIRKPDGTFHIVNNYLPINAKSGEELLGHPKNIWFGLSMVTYIMALEHNAVVERFRQLHPDWTGEQLFAKARLVISALVAKIQGVEWTPAIIQNKAGKFGQWHMFYGFLGQNFRRKIGNPRWLGNFISGILGGHLAYRGVNYAVTEEFASVYRMHPLLPESFTVRSATTGQTEATYSLGETIFQGSHKVNQSHSRLDVAYSMGTSAPGALVLNNYPTALRNIPDPIEPTVFHDLAAIDLVRDRERRVPRYNEFRRQFLLNPIKTWADLTSDVAAQRALAEVYGVDGVEKLDLLVGTLAEPKLPGFVFGETIYSVFVVQTQRRIECDRFLTDDYNAKVYTEEGIRWVEDTTFARILRRHFPGLRDVVADDANAFLMWKPKH